MKRIIALLSGLMGAGCLPLLWSRVLAQPPPELVTLTGTVFHDDTRIPIPNALVFLRRRGEEGQEAQEWAQTETDRTGGYRFERVPEGEYEVAARAVSWDPKDHARQFVRLTDQPAVVDLHTASVRRAAFRVLRPDGTPWANRNEFLKLQAYTALVALDQRAITDEDGVFSLLLPVPGEYGFCLRVPEAGWVRQDRFVLREDQDPGVVELRLSPGVTVAGKVHWRGTEEPAGNVVVRVMDRVFVVTMRTDDQGHFHLTHLPPGQMTLDAYTEGFSTDMLPLPLEAGHDRTDLVIDLPRGGVVSGHLRTADGVPEADLEARFWGQVEISPTQGTEVRYQARIEADGAYRVEKVRTGRHQWTVLVPGHGFGQSPPFMVAEGEEVPNLDLTLRPGRSVAGAVMDQETNRPAPDVLVSLSDFSDVHFEMNVRTNGRGEFAFQDVPPCKAHLQAYAERFAMHTRVLDLTTGKDANEVVIQLARLLRLRGRVVDASGALVSGATVTLDRSPGPKVTDSEGQFAFEGVSPGPHLLQVQGPGHPPTEATVQVKGPEPAPVEVRIPVPETGTQGEAPARKEEPAPVKAPAPTGSVEGPDTDARLALEVRPLSERKYLVGEPILLELQFRNVSPTAVVVDLGHRGRQSLTVEYEGQVYESEFLKTCPGGISRGYRASLGPGEVFSHTILLNEWVRFTKEGTYSLRLVYDGSQSFVKESSGLRATCPLMITVVAKEEGTLQPILEGYYRKATGKPFFQAELDFLALCFSGQDEALPFLRKVLPGALQGDSDSQIELFKGVRRVGTLAALDLLAEWMKSENQGIAHMATVEVGLIERTSPDPAVRARAGELLKEVPRDFRFVEPAIVD